MAVNKKDGEAIVRELNAKFTELSELVSEFMPPLPELLKEIPEPARKYSLQELIDFLEKAWKEGKLQY